MRVRSYDNIDSIATNRIAGYAAHRITFETRMVIIRNQRYVLMRQL